MVSVAHFTQNGWPTLQAIDCTLVYSQELELQILWRIILCNRREGIFRASEGSSDLVEGREIYCFTFHLLKEEYDNGNIS